MDGIRTASYREAWNKGKLVGQKQWDGPLLT